MSRSLTTALNNEILSPSLSPFMAIDLDFAGGNFLTWTGYGNISFGGTTYIGSGDIVTISTVSESSEVRANGVQVNLSGIPSDLIASALTDTYQGRTAIIYFGVINDQVIVADPYIMFRGRMDTMTVEDSGETATITLTVESRLIDLDRARERRFTSEDQKIDFPNDKGLEFITSLQDKAIVWGN